MELDIFNGTEREIICVSNNPSHPFVCGDTASILTIGKRYTVTDFEIHDWHTMVTLVEFPDLQFNSVLFEELEGEHNFCKPYISKCVLCGKEAEVWEVDDGCLIECGCTNCQVNVWENVDYDCDSEDASREVIARWNKLAYTLERREHGKHSENLEGPIHREGF